MKRISIFIIAMLLPAIVMAKATNDSSLEVLVRIGVDYGSEDIPLSNAHSEQDNTIKVLSTRILKSSARYMRRIQYSQSHIAVQGLDKRNNVVYQDALIDPRLIRYETTNKDKFTGRIDFYRATAKLTVVLPNDPRIAKLRLSKPRWNGIKFNLETMAVVPMRKLK